jgi:hypothetical protein
MPVDIAKAIKVFNIGGGIFLMILGFLLLINSTIRINPSFFMPIYIMIFGAMGILAEFNNAWLLDNCKFMRNYFGRGLFNIFLSTLTLAFYSEHDDSIRSILSLIAGCLYCIVGFIYLVMTCK